MTWYSSQDTGAASFCRMKSSVQLHEFGPQVEQSLNEYVPPESL